jgi:sulfate adenylyltransferase subunit 1
MTELTRYERPLLKFITCGSVDDGKSTLIGNILYNSRLLYSDQIESLKTESLNGSCDGELDYSLLLDGLLAEREQGITIDVAYRYFSTQKRSFIVADTPGHDEYTRNMAVGASFADLAIILIDASKGVLVQTRRHARICALMGIRHFVFAVNKMDLIGFDEKRFNDISADIAKLRDELSLQEYTVIPLSAKAGDNVISRSQHTPWYNGKSLIEYLEDTDTSKDNEETGFYLPVQRVCRPNQFFRGFQGQIESGELHVGDELTVLPTGESARVKQIFSGFDEVEQAGRGMPVTVSLDREVDVSRGSVFTRAKSDDSIQVAREITGTVLWTDDEKFSFHKDYLIKLGTSQIYAQVKSIEYTVDVNTGEHVVTDELSKNEIAVCRISFIDSVAVSEFSRHRALGEFILIDRVTNMTAACGIVNTVNDSDDSQEYTPQNVRRHLLRQKSAVFNFGGSGSTAGQETLEKLAGEVEQKLLQQGRLVYYYRNAGTGAAGEVIKALTESGIIVLTVKFSSESADGVKDLDPALENTGTDSIVKFIAEQTAEESR